LPPQRLGKLDPDKGVETVALLIILALIVALFVGLGFVVKWLFILAVIAALVWLIAFFMRGARA
jgi:amino acid transporter